MEAEDRDLVMVTVVVVMSRWCSVRALHTQTNSVILSNLGHRLMELVKEGTMKGPKTISGSETCRRP